MQAEYKVDGDWIVVWMPRQGSSRWPLNDHNLDMVEQMVAIYNYQNKKEQVKMTSDQVFVGNIHKCTAFKEETRSMGDSSHGKVWYDSEIIKENAILVKQGSRYLDVDDCDLSISGETTGPRYKDQVFVLEEELRPYQSQVPFKLIELDDELFLVPINGNLMIVPNDKRIKNAIAVILGSPHDTVYDRIFDKLADFTEKVLENPFIRHKVEQIEAKQKAEARARVR